MFLLEGVFQNLVVAFFVLVCILGVLFVCF